MNAPLATSCFVAVALSAAPFRIVPSLGEVDRGEVIRNAFKEFQKQTSDLSVSSKAAGASLMVTAKPTYWQCSDGETTLSVDLRGNASYRRVHNWIPSEPPGGRASGRPVSHFPDEAALIQRTREFAKPWLDTDQMRSLKPAVKRETLLLAQTPRGPITETLGRTIIRLLKQGEIDNEFFQAVFDAKGAVLRVDLAFPNARPKTFCDRDTLARIAPAKQPSVENPLTLGCFFDPAEYRFEISAFAVEGEQFLNGEQVSNPFGRDDFDLKASHRVSVQRYRDSQDYHWWCWAWWQRYGSVGGFRGNWIEKEGHSGWEYPQYQLLHHHSLSSYATVQGSPRQTKVIQQSDGPVEYPHAVSQTFAAAFYRDLEQCNVAFLFTHGGPIQGNYQVRRGLDVWAVLAPASRKLGAGKLRHLFLDGCAAFTYRREPQAAHLVKTWISQAPVNGVRTVCGVDGEASLLDRGGWRFFGYYNKGESVSDSWAFALLDEYIENCPVTAAYGNTKSEAAKSLLEGRFSDQKAQPKAVVISIWSGPTMH
jgi:hypothetical protein